MSVAGIAEPWKKNPTIYRFGEIFYPEKGVEKYSNLLSLDAVYFVTYLQAFRMNLLPQSPGQILQLLVL